MVISKSSSTKVFQWHNPKGIKLVTRLPLGLSHLWEIRLSTASKILWILFISQPILTKSESVMTRIYIAILWRVFQGWSKFANLECNGLFCFAYKHIWWTTLSSLNFQLFFLFFVIAWLQFYSFKHFNFSI